jgi:crossover junction endodeoxyribonuclease RuvC
MVACVEKVGAMHGQGVRSMFTFGQSYGFILGVLAALGIGVQLVPPGTWKKEFSLIGKDKAASIEVCKRLFPGVNLLPSEKCWKDSDGMAEALLLACYAKGHF